MKVVDLLPVVQRLYISASEDFSHRLPDIQKALNAVPPLYAQDGKGKKATAYLHYFSGGGDWYITELDKSNGRGFGYADLGYENGELGYLSIPEITRCRGVELDFYFEPKPLDEILNGKIH
jgi:hypothetical protein